jgi:hypothetical protein
MNQHSITPGTSSEPGAHRGHYHWRRIVFLVSVLVIAVTLVTSGVVGEGLLEVVLVCLAGIAAITIGMSLSGDKSEDHRDDR